MNTRIYIIRVSIEPNRRCACNIEIILAYCLSSFTVDLSIYEKTTKLLKLLLKTFNKSGIFIRDIILAQEEHNLVMVNEPLKENLVGISQQCKRFNLL